MIASSNALLAVYALIKIDGLSVPLLLGALFLVFYIYTLLDAVSGPEGPSSRGLSRGLVCGAVAAFLYLLVLPAFFGHLQQDVIGYYLIPGRSMEPTIMDNERLLVFKGGYAGAVAERGDIVVFKAPDDDDKEYIKRVAAVAGDRVEIKGGALHVNGAPYRWTGVPPDNARRDPFYNITAPLTLSEGEVFVVGDNPVESYDSRHFGPVNIERITGKAVKIIYSRGPDGVRWRRLGITLR